MDKSEKKIQRTLRGIVTSDDMEKTIVVAVDRMKQHPKYKKRYRVTKHYHVHDANNEYRKGDRVTFKECRPLSKTKNFFAVAKKTK